MNKTNLFCGILFSACAVGELACTIAIAKESKEAYDFDKRCGSFPESAVESLATGIICGGATGVGVLLATKFAVDAVKCFRHLKN